MKREKGLCYRCDDKWSVGHRCRRKEPSVLVTQEDDEDEGELSSGDLSRDGMDEGVAASVPAKISLNSVMGLTSPKTFKMKGNIMGKEVVVMVDPGATHNFLSKETIERT